MEKPEENINRFLGESLPDQPYLDEATLLGLITARVHQLLVEQPDLLWSFLYRLDVEESKIQQVLAGSADVAPDLARLILQRHKNRLESQKKYKEDLNQNPYDWSDL